MRVLITGGSGFIGKYLIRELLSRGAIIQNIDLIQCTIEDSNLTTTVCSLMDKSDLRKIILDFNPNMVFHLAARTNPTGWGKIDYSENWLGTENLIEVLNELQNLFVSIFISTQHVIKPGSNHFGDVHGYEPLGDYGESKVQMEKIIIEKMLSDFVILRPTNVWGVGNKVLETGIWQVLKKGHYIHPKSGNCLRSYGYVKNVAWQMAEIGYKWTKESNWQVLYVADENMKQNEWLLAFSLAFGKGNLRILPTFIVKVLANLGDTLLRLKIRFPINTPRYLNLITENQVPITQTFAAVGRGPVNFQDAVNETVLILSGHQCK